MYQKKKELFMYHHCEEVLVGKGKKHCKIFKRAEVKLEKWEYEFAIAGFLVFEVRYKHIKIH